MQILKITLGKTIVYNSLDSQSILAGHIAFFKKKLLNNWLVLNEC